MQVARVCCNNDTTLKKKYGIVRVYNIIYCIHYTLTYKSILLCTRPVYRHREGQTCGTTTRAAVTRTRLRGFSTISEFFFLLSGHSKPVTTRIKRNRFSMDVYFVFCLSVSIILVMFLSLSFLCLYI